MSVLRMNCMPSEKALTLSGVWRRFGSSVECGCSPNLTADLGQVHKQVMAASAEPLFSAFSFWTKAADSQPEFLGMVGDRKMHGLVGDKISQDSLRRHDQSPVEREVLQW